MKNNLSVGVQNTPGERRALVTTGQFPEVVVMMEIMFIQYLIFWKTRKQRRQE